MNFEFKCPQCGQTVEADESFRGQTAECPYCGKGIAVPSGTAKPAVKPSKCGNGFMAGKEPPVKRGWQRIFSSIGRASRKEFWIIEGIFLICCLVLLAVVPMCSSFMAKRVMPYAIEMIYYGFGGALVLGLVGVRIGVEIRRLHDLNRRGLWLLPFIVGNIACEWYPRISLFSVLMYLASFAWLIVLGSLDGTPGDNDYGSDPKGRAGSGERTNTAKIAIWLLTAISTVITITAILARSFMPELFEKEEQSELRQSAPDDQVDHKSAEKLFHDGLSDAFKEQGNYLRVGDIFDFVLIKASGNTYNGLAKVKIHTRKGTPSAAVIRYSLKGTFDGAQLLLEWEALSADLSKLSHLFEEAGYDE